MEFFGISLYGPQNYIKDQLNDNYHEPRSKAEVKPLMEKVINSSSLPIKLSRPDINTIRIVDIYIGRVDGFAYGSTQRFMKMKRKGVIKPVGPADMYRLPSTSSYEYGWWQHDPAITSSDWHVTSIRYPQPVSPYSRVLDVVKKNNKYATLF
ncbi:uncharacterized protein LOC112058566 [Bicyclus anynana]|uniref:Uncharacterized protein LOC112058566 n=1 Tax=Bicyclus anynana TaxID=110368 RepID=A0A6J1PBU9_BICAN|nr:uncharacterized protein LOC112058566 [Bicyclus anynana]